jgi:hypothetical protein
MHKNFINFSDESLKPSDYTIKFLLNFSKSIQTVKFKKNRKMILYCN